MINLDAFELKPNIGFPHTIQLPPKCIHSTDIRGSKTPTIYRERMIAENCVLNI